MYSKKLTTSTLFIKGMHCASCNILVEKTLSQLEGVKQVSADFARATVTIIHSSPLDKNKIDNLLRGYNYFLVNENKSEYATSSSTGHNLQIFVSLSIIIVAMYFIKDFLPVVNNISLSINTPLNAFLLGLLASISTCMATSGVILYALLKNLDSTKSALRFASIFAMGRLLMYALAGFFAGSFGALVFGSKYFGIYLILLNTILMVVALHLAQILPKKLQVMIQKTTSIYTTIESKIPSSPIISPLLYGMLTLFLACGFTWSVILQASTLGSSVRGATLTGAFALGTLPMLLLLGFFQNLRLKPLVSYLFNLTVASIIFLLALSSIASQLQLYIPLDIFSQNHSGFEATQQNSSKQTLEMRVNANGYSPSRLVVKKGIPVTWKIWGDDILGCQGTIQAPKAGINLTPLKQGLNEFSFIPQDKGIISFACSMGMYKGEIEVI